MSRSDAVCCSSACRVWLHRHPELREMYDLLKVSLPFAVKASAYRALFPEREDAIRDGTLNLEHPRLKDVLCDEAASDCRRAFAAAAFAAAAVAALNEREAAA